MCGITAILSRDAPVNQLIYRALLLLQHRGQDAAGIATESGGYHFHMRKGQGMVRDVFRTRDMRSLPGQLGIGQVRYPTAGNAQDPEESQPFYVNAPYGIALAHNGNLTNAASLRNELFALDRRHINTGSDSEILLNVLADEIESAMPGMTALTPHALFQAVARLHERVRGSYAAVAMIAGHGLLAFRDPFGIRPLCFGRDEKGGVMVASESVALTGCGFHLERDLEPGEAVFIDHHAHVICSPPSPGAQHIPCAFEYVYLARPDSIMNGISVYQARMNLGELLAARLAERIAPDEIEAVISVPESSRPAAMQLAQCLGRPYREGFVKNRYIGRTFIMPDQQARESSVRQKLNPMPHEFNGKTVLIVDDSIVRGTTSREIVQMARDAGARRVFFASAAPPVRFRNVYGIDLPDTKDLIAAGVPAAQIEEKVRNFIHTDGLLYQRPEALADVILKLNPKLNGVDSSCFDGHYVAGEMEEGGESAPERASR